VAAAGAGVGYRCGSRGIRSHCFRLDLVHRAPTRAGAVPAGRADILHDGTQLPRTYRLGRVDLPLLLRLPARILLSERIFVRGHVSAGECIFIPVRVYVQVAERLRVAQPLLPVLVRIRVPFRLAVAFCIAIAIGVDVGTCIDIAIDVGTAFCTGARVSGHVCFRGDIRVTVDAG
jgi:hypothetical protein